MKWCYPGTCTTRCYSILYPNHTFIFILWLLVILANLFSPGSLNSFCAVISLSPFTLQDIHVYTHGLTTIFAAMKYYFIIISCRIVEAVLQFRCGPFQLRMQVVFSPSNLC